MPPTHQTQTSAEPKVYGHSLDWRFLLPLGHGINLLVLSSRNPDLELALRRAGISSAGWREEDLEIPNPLDTDGAEFDAVALPLGLSGREGAAHPADRKLFYQHIRRRLRPEGYLLVGFENRWRDRFGRKTKYYTSTPAVVRDELQKAGFSGVECFGVSPNLDVPEYILQLQRRALEFTVGHRFRRSAFAGSLMQMLLKLAGPIWAGGMFPCYYVVAKA